MLAPAFRRAIQPACSACSSPAQSVSRSTGLAITASTQGLTHRPLHQRRHSSSKASSPPGEDSKAVPGPSQPAKTSTSGKSTEKSSSGRGRRKAASLSANIPKVPSTTHLERIDVHTSSCFAMHRPISVTTPFPPASTIASFNSLFDATQTKFADVIYTLSDAVESLEAAGQFKEEVEMRDPHPQVFGSNTAPLGAPLTLAELDQLLAQCVPFRPPPPPVPAEAAPKRKPASRTPTPRGPPKHKSWSVNVNVTESTYSDGRRTWTFAASEPQQVDSAPPTLVAAADAHAEAVAHPPRVANQPFLRRMHARSRDRLAYLAQRGVSPRPRQKMRLISVKRQRKIKMKKHKYKKLRKRTRLERRKLEDRRS